MKRFVIKFLCIAIPLSLPLGYLEYKLGQIRNIYNFKHQCLDAQLDSVEVLILGTSHATYGINPDFFDLKGFNISNIGQPLYYDTRIVLTHIDQMPQLKYVLINISYFSLGYQLADGLEQWRDYYYSQFWNIDFSELNIYDIRKYSKIFLYTPTTTVAYYKKDFKIDLIGDSNPNGYLRADTSNNRVHISDALGKKRVLVHENQYLEKRVAQNLSDLEQLVSELKRKKIVPVFISAPMCSTYKKYVDPNKLKKNNDAIAHICQKYTCKYYNYFDDNRFEIRDFKDNDHLNFIGAEKFSTIINNEILKSKEKRICQSLK